MNRDIDKRIQDSAPATDELAHRSGGSIDRSVLEQLNALSARGSDEPFAVKAAKLYLNSTAYLVAGMQDALAIRDANAIRLAAHTLKSSSHTLGARNLARLAEDLESLAHGDSLSGADGLVTAVVEEYGRACAELARFIEEATGPP